MALFPLSRKFVLRAVFVPVVVMITIYLVDHFTSTDASASSDSSVASVTPNTPVRGGGGDVRGWTLVLDLDETLVNTRGDMTLFRPYVDSFLAQVFAWFDKVVVFTAGTKPYADPILDTLEQRAGVKFHDRLYRDSCTLMPTGWVKDMTKVQTNLRRLLIIDNTPASYSLQPQCGVAIPSYWGQKGDEELLLMLSTLFARLSSHKAH